MVYKDIGDYVTYILIYTVSFIQNTQRNHDGLCTSILTQVLAMSC